MIFRIRTEFRFWVTITNCNLIKIIANNDRYKNNAFTSGSKFSLCLSIYIPAISNILNIILLSEIQYIMDLTHANVHSCWLNTKVLPSFLKIRTLNGFLLTVQTKLLCLLSENLWFHSQKFLLRKKISWTCLCSALISYVMCKFCKSM